MAVEFNHTILNVKDKQESATFVGEIHFTEPSGHFLEVMTRPYS